jgi:hypothetical protein
MVLPVTPVAALRRGGRVIPATPVRLRGDEASIVVPLRAIPASSSSHLVLEWPDGSTTELEIRLRGYDAGGRLAHVDVLTVKGDWAAFVAYLGLVGGI